MGVQLSSRPYGGPTTIGENIAVAVAFVAIVATVVLALLLGITDAAADDRGTVPVGRAQSLSPSR